MEGDFGGDGGGEVDSGGVGDAPVNDSYDDRAARPDSDSERSQSGSSADKASADAAKAADKAEAAARLRFKRGGREREATLDEIKQMLSDEYEEEFEWGQGDKAVKVKADRHAIMRALQKEQGALGKMRQYQEALQRHQQELEFGKQNPADFYAYRLGLHEYKSRYDESQTGYTAWILDQAADWYEEQRQIAEMQNPQSQQYNPMRANAMIEARARKELQRQQALEQQQRQQAEQRRQYEAQKQKRQAELGEAFKNAGVPWNAKTEAIAQHVWAEHKKADATDILDDRTLATLVKKEWTRQALEVLDSHEGGALLELLGSDRRKLLRELELGAVKEQKNEQRREQRQQASAQPNGRAEKKDRNSPVRYERGKGASLV